jgi:hypothetical protein
MSQSFHEKFPTDQTFRENCPVPGNLLRRPPRDTQKTFYVSRFFNDLLINFILLNTMALLQEDDDFFYEHDA